MSDDLVRRLRETQNDWPACLVKIEHEAADRIEQVEAELILTHRLWMVEANRVDELEEALRDAIEDIRIWGSLTDKHYQDRFGLEENISKYTTALEGKKDE